MTAVFCMQWLVIQVFLFAAYTYILEAVLVESFFSVYVRLVISAECPVINKDNIVKVRKHTVMLQNTYL